MLTELEHRQLVVEYNDSAAPYPADRTIVDLIEAQVARTPDDEAIRFGQRSLTYRQLDGRANQIAAHLRALGVGTGELVTLFMEHSIEVVCAILGVLKTGAAYVPVDAGAPGERLAFMLEDIARGIAGTLPVIVTQSHLAGRIPSGAALVVSVNAGFETVALHPDSKPRATVAPSDLAYVIYTSGSTGKPKGVMIEHRSLVNYIWWAAETYCRGERLTFPLFSSLAFDLTVTSIFTPLISGGRIVVYHENAATPGMVIRDVVEDGAADIVKLTPAHLAMIKDMSLRDTRIRKLILGGEDLKTTLARDITRRFGRPVDIYNEYGPTEATVGCMIHRYDIDGDVAPSVPIGVPAANAGIYVLDEELRPVPPGVIGEMYLAGDGLARGYFNRPELTAQKFVTAPHPGRASQSLRLYKTEDLARWTPDGRMEFLGRADHQVKVGGARVELGEIEAQLLQHPAISACVVNVVATAAKKVQELSYCARCGLASNLPGTTFDGEGICNTCRAYESYVDKAEAYFKSPDELKAIIEEMKAYRTGDYDCMVMLSGGKDSTYMLYQLVGLGVKPLVFTLDNGFLSEEAMANIRRVVQALGVDHVFGTTPHMNEIFVDSLKRFANVCNGCFKTIYTLATNLAVEKNIRYIVTGLSRGQFFETRLTEEVFQRKDFHVDKLDALVLEARKSYHRRSDAVSHNLEVEIFLNDSVYDDIQYIDFYRYWSVPLSEMYDFLQKYVPWTRPSDTGRSTNCLINDVGIYLHKKLRGYHSYALPYSWDVRLAQKTREQAMEELDDEIDETRVREMMAQIGYAEPLPDDDDTVINRLAAYYCGDENIPAAELRAHLAQSLPGYMVPTYFVRLEALPLTSNGKVDRDALPPVTDEDTHAARNFVAPRTETEKALAAIWAELLKVQSIGIHDDFFDLGGQSLLAIRAVSRIADVFDVNLSLESLFANPTIATLAVALSTARAAGSDVQRIERRENRGPSSLSFAQEQLWFLDQLSPGNPVYNMVDVIPFRGSYNAAAVRQSLHELARRHEILRTSFAPAGGRPAQIVDEDIDLAFAELDFRSLTAGERESEWLKVVREEGRKPFDLSRAPLFRATLIRFSDREHRLLFTIHHIIADEWSMEVIHKELAAHHPLPDLPIQYADFARWQRAWLQGEALQKQIAYWREELAGAPCVLELPADKPRPAVQSFRGASEMFQLPKALLERLKSLGKEEQATLFMVLQASFMALLHRYTGQDDILVGTPITGRTQTETENLIGCFINTVVMRARFNSGMNFRSLLQQIRQRALGAYAHPELPLEHLVAELAPERDASRTPLFQVMFVVHDSQGVSQVSKVSGNRQLETGTSKFDLTLLLSETENGADGMIEYSTDLFEAGTIRRLCRHYATLLDAITEEPDQYISRLTMLTAEERQQLLVEWNDTAAPYPDRLCAHQLIEQQAALHADRVAVVFGSDSLTYGELDARADRLARQLRDRGVGPDVLVGLLVERSIDMMVALLGVMKAGGAYVPLDPAFPPERLAYMVEDSGMPVLVTHRDLDGILPVPPPSVLRLDRDWNEVASRPPAPSSPGDLAYVLYTSGSTGKPKGVGVPHSALVNFLVSMQRSPGFASTDTLLAVTTLSFDIAGLELYLPLISGGTVVIASRDEVVDPALLLQRMTDSGCTVMQATPATWRALIAAGWTGSVNLKILCGGEALPADLARALLTRGSELWNMYGPTETTIWSVVERITSAAERVPIGRPIANTTVYILDADRNLVPAGHAGELYIGGAGLARGYLHRDDLTRERFVPNRFEPNGRMYRTGDLARWLPDGRIECLGRIDRQVKLRGFRIEPGEIEAVIKRHEAVRDVVVTAREDTPGDRRLVAYLVTNDPPADLADQLRAILRASLPEYMVPSAFVALDALPRTANGKLDPKALPAPAAGQVTSRVAVPPRTATEETVMGVFRDVLERTDFAVFDSFFDLGGHSLMAARLMAQLRVKAGVDLPLRNLFERPTVAALSEAIDALSWSAEWQRPAATAGNREEIEL